jgi:glycine/D-amino acid oxidase-like deaminating enzyme
VGAGAGSDGEGQARADRDVRAELEAVIGRRAFVRGLGLAALAGCAHVGFERPSERRFQRVRVSRDRVIRTVQGIRPFRPAGFVVRAEPLGAKTVIHNYGHGGGGVSLSWGTAHLALELALPTPHRRCAVLGCGAVGLATARLLQRHGFEVTIYARDLPPETTSNVAGAEWSPFSVADPEARTPEFVAQLDRASHLSHRYFQNLVGDRYGVRWIDAYQLSDRPITQHDSDLFPERHALAQHPFGAAHAAHFSTMLIEPPVYLEAMLHDVREGGAQVIVRELHGRDDVLALPEPLIANCTGLGARELFGDTGFVPARGQLVFLLPQPEIDYLTVSDQLLYMFPRRDGILLGGTFERGVESLAPDPAAIARILDGNARLL